MKTIKNNIKFLLELNKHIFRIHLTGMWLNWSCLWEVWFCRRTYKILIFLFITTICNNVVILIHNFRQRVLLWINSSKNANIWLDFLPEIKRKMICAYRVVIYWKKIKKSLNEKLETCKNVFCRYVRTQYFRWSYIFSSHLHNLHSFIYFSMKGSSK